MLLFSLCSSTKCRSSNGECNIALFVEEDGSKYDVIEILPSNGRIDDRSHFLGVKRRERDGTLKRKSCLSETNSFSFNGISDRSSQKSFLHQGKRKSKDR